MGAIARPQNTGGPGAKQSHPRTSYSGVLKSGATKTEEKTSTKIKKKKKSKDTKKKPKDKKKKDKDEDKAPVIELPFRPREPWKSPVIEVTEITDDMSDVPMPDIESSDDEKYGIGPDAQEEVDASLYFKLIEEDEKIHPDDFEKRIAHCEEALEQANQKIAPVIQDRLNLLEAQRDQRDELLDKWPDQTYSVALRLDFFERLKAFLLADGDPNQVISCINAIVKAYKHKTLQWVPGYVTYWSYGKQLTQLRAFDWEEFLIWNFKYKGVKGFWVEGLRDTPVKQFLQHRTCWRARYDTFQDMDVKVPIGLKFCLPPHSHRQPDPNTNVVPGRFTNAEAPRSTTWFSTVPRGTPGEPLVNGNPPRGGEKRPGHAGGPANIMWYGPEDRDPSTNTTVLFWMTDDTGADVCSIQERDLEQMYHVKNNHEDPSVMQAQPPLLAYYEMRGASAGDPHQFVPCRAMRIHCYANKDVDGRLNTMLKQAELIEVLITKNSLNPFDPPVRLLGPWLRHRFYTATSPDRSGRLYIYKRHLQLITIRPSDPPLSGAFPMVNNLRIGPEHPAAEQDLVIPP